uniref:AXH domain-containing protein n=2 Tax=Lygus hesperus TaxID=30085 RepID=A0A0K8TI46_LYGHE
MMRSGAGGGSMVDPGRPPPLRLPPLYPSAGAAEVVPEFLRPLPPPRYAPPVRPLTTYRKEDEDTFSTTYRTYPYPYHFPYLTYPMIRPLEAYPYNSPPQSPLVRKPPIRLPSVKERKLKRSRAGPVRGFAKGSLIRLTNGELKRVEDMRTEDFISSAESSSLLRLDPSTVVRIESTNESTSAILTLSYGPDRSQVEVECSTEHPYFVYGQGWASCRPERTLMTYGLKVHQLQVGDVCISLSPRPGAVVPTSSTTCPPPHSSAPPPAPTPTSAASALADRKRRWSAPDDVHDQVPPPGHHAHESG